MILNVELQQCVIMDEEINVCITTLTLTGVKSTILPDIDHNPPLITKSTAQGDGMLFSASKIHLLFKWRHAQFLKIDQGTSRTRDPHMTQTRILLQSCSRFCMSMLSSRPENQAQKGKIGGLGCWLAQIMLGSKHCCGGQCKTESEVSRKEHKCHKLLEDLTKLQ